MFSVFKRSKGNAKFDNTPPPNSPTSPTMDSLPGESYRKISDGSLPSPTEIQQPLYGQKTNDRPTTQPKPAPRPKPKRQNRESGKLVASERGTASSSNSLVTEAISLLQRSLSQENDREFELTGELNRLRLENKQLQDKLATVDQEREHELQNGHEDSELLGENEELKKKLAGMQQQLTQIQGIAGKLNDQNKQLFARYQEITTANDEEKNKAAEEHSKRIGNLISMFWQLENNEKSNALKELGSDIETGEGISTDSNEFLNDLFVVSFQLAKDHMEKLKSRFAHLLLYPGSPSQEMESTDVRADPSILPESLKKEMSAFLKGNTNSWPLQELEMGIMDWIEEEFSSNLTENDIMKKYISCCCRVSWQLNIEFPPLVIEADARCYDNDKHQPDVSCRLQQTPDNGTEIGHFVWPVLLEKNDGKVLKKGIVILKS
ncbi:uncharacterized protein LOC144447855 [Glandiceps talaboti]